MNDFSKVLEEAGQDILEAATTGWQTVVDAVEALEPELQADLGALLKEAEADFTAGKTVDEIVTALLNLAESKGAQFVIDLGTAVLRGLVANLLAAL